MKRIFCVLLALALALTALSACSKGNMKMETTTAANTAAGIKTSTENITNKTTESANEKEADLTAKQFLNALKNKDMASIIKLTQHPFGTDYTEYPKLYAKLKEAYSFFNDIDVQNYTIINSENQMYSIEYTVDLVISKSGSALFPVGTSRWKLDAATGNVYITLFKPAGKTITIVPGDEKNEIINFCNFFSEQFKCFRTMEDFNTLVPDVKDTRKFNEFCYRLSAVLYKKNTVKRELLESRAKTVLGLTGIDFKKCNEYNAKDDTLVLGGRGSSWYYCALNSETFNSETKRHTVVLDYYSDTAFILKAVTVKYLVRENNDKSFTLLSTELLKDSGVPLAGGST